MGAEYGASSFGFARVFEGGLKVPPPQILRKVFDSWGLGGVLGFWIRGGLAFGWGRLRVDFVKGLGMRSWSGWSVIQMAGSGIPVGSTSGGDYLDQLYPASR